MEHFYCKKCEKTYSFEMSRRDALKVANTKTCEVCGTHLQLLTENNL